MKKLSLFLSIFLVALSFSSCSNDDDNNNVPDQIINKWRLSEVTASEDSEVFDDFLDECSKKSTIEFFENGTYRENDYEFDFLTDTCEALDPVNGTWQNLGNSNYNLSDIEIPGLTVTLSVKITFVTNKMIIEFTGTMDVDGTETEFSVKVTYIENDSYVPDSIIGKWQLDQEFADDVEIELTDCEKTMTIEFFEDGIYKEKDFNDEEGECIAEEEKNGLWLNLGADMYDISNLGVSDFKVTFSENKMTLEFTDTEEEVTQERKLIFVKATS